MAGSYYGVPYKTLEDKVKKRNLLRPPKKRDLKKSPLKDSPGGQPTDDNPLSPSISIPVFLTIDMIKNDPMVLDEKSSIMNEKIEEESIPIEKSSTVEQPINAIVLILLINKLRYLWNRILSFSQKLFSISFLDHLNHRKDQENVVQQREDRRYNVHLGLQFIYECEACKFKFTLISDLQKHHLSQHRTPPSLALNYNPETGW
jgi:hypothetical protein